MAINYASKYSSKVDERFTEQSITENAVNNDYDWDGVNTVNVYSIATAEIGDYSATGLNRYGDPEELGDAVQTMVLSQDKAFTFTIDRSNYDDTMMTKEAGKALRRQIDEKVVPLIDGYRIAKMANYAGKTGYGTIDATTAYDEFLKLNLALKGPKQGRIAYVSNSFYRYLHLDSNFIKASDVAQNMLISGSLGVVDGVNIIPADDFLPTNCDFVITNSIATVSPMKLQDYKIHENPPGINGWLVEGRLRFDAFVLDNKKNAIGSHWDTQAHIPGTAGTEVTAPENIPNVVPSITLNKAATSVAVGANETLNAVITGAPADTAITWASSATAKATVSNKGKVTGVATGNTVVTATITVDDVEYTAACDVTVVSA